MHQVHMSYYAVIYNMIKKDNIFTETFPSDCANFCKITKKLHYCSLYRKTSLTL